MLQPTPSAQGASTSTETRRRQQVSIRRIQRTIGTLAEDLRALDALIGGIAQELPPARETFDALAEVGEGLRCVKADLLADAVETLQVIATSNEADLLRRFEQRQSWLEAEGE